MAYMEGQKEKEKRKQGTLCRLYPVMEQKSKKEYTALLYAGYFSTGSFLFDSGVCRDPKGKLKLACDWL